jgi:Predicted membrane protein
MAKKSNKTEHVLKLITKNEEAALDEDFFVIKKPDKQETPAEQPESETIQEQPLIEAKEEPPAAEAGETPAEPVAEAEKTPAAEPVAQEVKEKITAEEIVQEPPAAAPEQEQEGASETLVSDSGSDLVNLAEILAREKISLVMERMKVCGCRTCFNDVLALTLNSLPTKYVTKDAGKQYHQIDTYKKSYETDILAALTKACVRVKAAPRH